MDLPNPAPAHEPRARNIFRFVECRFGDLVCKDTTKYPNFRLRIEHEIGYYIFFVNDECVVSLWGLQDEELG